MRPSKRKYVLIIRCGFLQGLTTEGSIAVRYVPLSLFRVNPVTRCSNDIPGHTEAILHVQFSPDGSILGTGGGDKTVRFWDIATCTPITTCTGHKYAALSTNNEVEIMFFVQPGHQPVVTSPRVTRVV